MNISHTYIVHFISQMCNGKKHNFFCDHNNKNNSTY